MSAPKESELLPMLAQMIKIRNVEVKAGVAAQDDAAIVKVSDSTDLVIASDFVRGSGFNLFKLGFLKYRDIGYYLAAANISDIAAMGARPTGLLSVIRYSKSMSKESFQEVMTGIEEACTAHACTLVGGDSGTYDLDVFVGTAFGFVPSNTALERRSFRAGQAIYVSGTLGRPIAALQYFSQGAKGSIPVDQEEELLASWRRPNPRVDIAEKLRACGLVRSCMDVSDGLTASILQLRSITGTGARIYAERIPLAPTVLAVADVLNVDRFELACGASVDFQLLFSVDENDVSRFENWASTSSLDVTRIGETLSNGELEFVELGGGRRPQLPGVPWDHQVGSIEDVFAKRKS